MPIIGVFITKSNNRGVPGCTLGVPSPGRVHPIQMCMLEPLL